MRGVADEYSFDDVASIKQGLGNLQVGEQEAPPTMMSESSSEEQEQAQSESSIVDLEKPQPRRVSKHQDFELGQSIGPTSC